MPPGHLWHKSGEQRREQQAQPPYQAARLPQRDHPQPEGEKTNETDREFDSEARHLEQRADHALEYIGVTLAEPLV